jgi:hypothetical protein
MQLGLFQEYPRTGFFWDNPGVENNARIPQNPGNPGYKKCFEIYAGFRYF